MRSRSRQARQSPISSRASASNPASIATNTWGASAAVSASRRFRSSSATASLAAGVAALISQEVAYT